MKRIFRTAAILLTLCMILSAASGMAEAYGDYVCIVLDENYGDGYGDPELIEGFSGQSIDEMLAAEDRGDFEAMRRWRDDYEFLGWNTKADGTGDTVTGDMVVTEDRAIYAQWREIGENRAYTELSQYIHSDISETARRLENVQWDSFFTRDDAWVSDSVCLYANGGWTSGGMLIDSISIDETCQYTLFGLTPGMGKGSLDGFEEDHAPFYQSATGTGYVYAMGDARFQRNGVLTVYVSGSMITRVSYYIDYEDDYGPYSGASSGADSFETDTPVSGNGAEAGYVIAVSGDTNVRTGPGLGYDVLDVMQMNTRLSFAGGIEYDDRGVAWYAVIWKNTQAWVSSRYTERM